ncbi:hypothetical protein [Sulfurimonas sp. HSL-1716]|uniref:hypothetical protein n=1 Tax=Hydrocurvibacter sulfurireducens TaxID=3131937 RepID=UPI0031F7AB7D
MKYILALCFLSIWLNASTNDYELVINKRFNSSLYDVVEDNDDQISAVGFLDDLKSSNVSHKTYTNPFDYLSSINTAYGTQMHIVRVDNTAKITLEKSANLSRFNKAVSLIKTTQNGYFIGGYTLNGQLLVTKLDASGNQLFIKEFGTKNFDKMSRLIALRDGGVLAVGSSTTTRDAYDPLYNTGLGLNDIFITRFSRKGEILWSKKYGTQNDDRGIDAAEGFDGSIVVLGSTSFDSTEDVVLMRLNEQGDKIWFKTYALDKPLKPYALTALKDGTFLASVGSIEENKKEQINLLKFDLQKNILMTNPIHTAYASALYDIKQASNGSIIGVGEVRDFDNSDTDGLAMKFDASLKLSWQEHFGYDGYDVFHHVAILRNGKYAVVGTKTLEGSEISNMWILKLNSDGTVAQKSTSAKSFYDRLCQVFKEEIKAGKVMIKEDLSISLNDENLYFKAGQYKLTEVQKNFLDAFWKKLDTAMTKYKSDIKTLEINGHTSSEWANADFSKGYLNNTNLSYQRSFGVISYIFNKQDLSTKKWLTKILKQSGYSYSKKVLDKKGNEDKKSSRRVTFKIYLTN